MKSCLYSFFYQSTNSLHVFLNKHVSSHNKSPRRQNNKGQGLVEYLIIVALIAVSSVWVIRIVGKNLQAGFGNIANVLSGTETKTIDRETVQKNEVNKRDFSNFMNGSIDGSNKKSDAEN